jgi:glutaredoxin 3
MPDRVMYVKPGCPYCQAARDALSAEGLEWEERDATASAELRAELMEHSRDSGVVPTIVAPDGVTIGWHGKG